MNTLWQDITYGIRKLLRQPWFTAVSILTLALGFGMNASIFSIVNAIVLRPLPAPHAERLVVVSSTVQRENLERRAVSYQDFLDWRAQNRAFELLAAHSDTTFIWTPEKGDAMRFAGELITADYLPMLGAKPHLGRLFQEQDDRNGSALAVVSYDFWKNRLGGDPRIVGKLLVLDEKPVEVIGVLPSGFYPLSDEAELWMPISSLKHFGSANLVENRGARWLDAYGRMRRGVTIAQAGEQMISIARSLAEQYPTSNRHYGTLLIPLHEELLGDAKSAALTLFGAAGFVLLIACANIANLMLVRTAARRREFAVRTALGASRMRMGRQLVTESLIVCLSGAVAGILLAVWLVNVIRRFSPVTIPEFISIGVDVEVLQFTILMSVITGIVIGLITMVRLNGAGPHDALKEASSSTTYSRSGKRMRNLLVAAETALAFVLLIGAGLMIRSFNQILEIRPGFQKERLLTMTLALPESKYSGEPGHAFRSLLLERVQSMGHGIQSAALTSDVPLGNSTSATIITPEGKEAGGGVRVYLHSISPDFFKTMSIPILNGRSFTSQDKEGGMLTAVVSRKMASRLWPNAEAIGKRIKFGRPDSQKPWLTVVGVVDEVKHRSLVEDPIEDPDDPDLYIAMAQYEEASPVLLVRTAEKPNAIAAAIHSEIQKLDRSVPIYSVQTMEDLFYEETALPRFLSFLMMTFAGIALALACIGLFGVLNDAVSQQTREIGIRIALGASRYHVFRMVLMQAAASTIGGLAAGLFCAIALVRLIAGQLYGVSPTEPQIYAGIALLMMTVALLAASLPARKASRVHPVMALKYE